MRLNSPEGSDGIEHGDTASMDLADIIAGEEGLDFREQGGPTIGKIVSDDSLEGVGELNGDAP